MTVKNLWQALRGIMIALASIGLLFGGLSLSLAEGRLTAVPAPTLTLPPTSSPTWQPFTPPADSPTPPPPTWTPSLPPPPTTCPPPPGWLPYVVQPGDTLDKLAAYYQISNAELGQANCLLTTELLPGVIIYVPRAYPNSDPVRPAAWLDHLHRPARRHALSFGTGLRDCRRRTPTRQLHGQFHTPACGPETLCSALGHAHPLADHLRHSHSDWHAYQYA